MKTIAQEWKLFAATIIPPDAGPTQREEMKKAFYAGATIMLAQMKSAPNELGEEGAIVQFENWEMELMEYVAGLIGENLEKHTR